jgi:hypothetical protein
MLSNESSGIRLGVIRHDRNCADADAHNALASSTMRPIAALTIRAVIADEDNERGIDGKTYSLADQRLAFAMNAHIRIAHR